MKNGFRYNKHALLALALVSMIGCSSTDSVNDKTSNNKTAETTSVGKEIAFSNDMLKEGLKKERFCRYRYV